MSPQKWTLLSSKNVSPSKWFPIESRTYQLPNSQVIDDFTVATLGNAAMIVPITTDHKVVLVRQFKPGANEVMLQFPAGRVEQSHTSIAQTARHELEEETGIIVSEAQLHQYGKFSVASTKNSECVFFFLAENCEFNSIQKLDKDEDIEVVTFTFDELDEKILSSEVWCVQTIAAWLLAKVKFPNKITSKG